MASFPSLELFPFHTTSKKTTSSDENLASFPGLPTVQFMIAFTLHTASDHKLDGGRPGNPHRWLLYVNKTIVLQVKEVAYSASNNIMGESWEKDAACSGKIESGDSLNLVRFTSRIQYKSMIL